MKTIHFKLFVIQLVLATKLFSQISPGGVSTGLETWLKADLNVIGTSPITAWNNSNPAGTATILWGGPSINNSTTSFNYNPVIEFVAPAAPYTASHVTFLQHPNRQFVTLAGFENINGINYNSLFWCLKLNDLSRRWTHLATTEGVTSGGPVNGTLHGNANGAIAGLQFPGSDNGFEGATVWRRDGVNVGYSSNHATNKNLLSAVGTNSTTLNCFLGGQFDNASGFLGHFRDWRGPVGEIIGYTSALSATDRQKVETYLAIKYGISYNLNYLATNGTTIYTTTAPYNNNIIGIGRDSLESLHQKQSHTNDDVFRIYLGSLASSNSINSIPVSQNISYVIVGDNAGVICATSTSNAEILSVAGCLPTSRLTREWKLQKTNFTDDVNFDITLPSCAAPSLVNPSELVLLVDDDGNFANGGTQCFYNGDGSGILISYFNPQITITGINSFHFPNNSIKYFTIGSVSLNTPLPIELENFTSNCLNSGVMLEWITNSELNTEKFEVEYSRDGISWYLINSQPAAGNSTSSLHYSFFDYSVVNETVYYRLKQYDMNGEFHQIGILSSNCTQTESFSPIVNIDKKTITILNQGYNGNTNYTLKLFDLTGREILCVNFDFENENYVFDYSLMNITSGCYFIQLIDNQGGMVQSKQLL